MSEKQRPDRGQLQEVAGGHRPSVLDASLQGRLRGAMAEMAAEKAEAQDEK